MRMFDLSTGIWTQHAVSCLLYMLHECGVWRLPIACNTRQYANWTIISVHLYIYVSVAKVPHYNRISKTRDRSFPSHFTQNNFFIDVLNMMDGWFDCLLTVRFVFLGFLFLFRFPFLVLLHLNRTCFLCCIFNHLTLASIM